jgi:ribokinase
MGVIDIIGLGAMNIDHLYLVQRILTDGEAPLKGAISSPGGSAANTIYGLAKLGISTGFIGAIGDDETGQALIRDFKSAGVDSSQIKVKPKAETGSVLCLTDRAGRRALYVSPGANRLLASRDIDMDYLNQAKIVHLSSFVDREQFKIQKSVVSELSPSVKVSLALGELYAAKGLRALAPIIKRTYILFLNRHELEQLTHEGLEKGVQRCIEQGCQIVAITLGKGVTRQGKTIVCYLSDGEQTCMIEGGLSGERSVIDTTGAGDAFAAGVLYGLLTGKSLYECGLLGEIMAQFCISETGARAGLPSLAELNLKYKERIGRTI